MTPSTVLLLADAAATTGLGHWVRSVALADELARRGWQIRVALRPDATAGAARDARIRGWPVSRWDAAAPPEPGDDRRVVVVDSYRVDAAFIHGYRSNGWITVVIDDLADRGPLAADMVVNQNLGAEQFEYQLPRFARLLLGPTFALLRRQFSAYRTTGLERVAQPVSPDTVLVMMGGSDASGALEPVVQACLDALPGAHVRAIAPTDSADRLRTLSTRRLDLLAPTPEIAAEMVRADTVITAGGTSVWELCATARPFGIVVVADNQIDATRRLERADAARIVGHLPLSVSGLSVQIAALVADGDALARRARTASTLVDGLGCVRVADQIEQITT